MLRPIITMTVANITTTGMHQEPGLLALWAHLALIRPIQG